MVYNVENGWLCIQLRLIKKCHLDYDKNQIFDTVKIYDKVFYTHRSIDVWYQYFANDTIPQNISENAVWTGPGNIFADEICFQGLNQNGVITVSDSNVLINYCRFSNCSSNNKGTCVSLINGESIHLKICCFNCSTADIGAYIYNVLSDEKGKRNFIFESSITDTVSKSDASFWIEYGKIDINTMNNSYNYATYNPFCVIRPGNANNTTFTFCEIFNNTSPFQAIFWSYRIYFEIISCEFIKNYQSDRNFCLFHIYGVGQIRNSIFISNICNKLFPNNVIVDNSFLKSNTEKSDSSSNVKSTINALPFKFDKFLISCRYYNIDPTYFCMYPYQCIEFINTNIL